jgi:Ser/Thr protein kinase RdoA (MazF antagonist)
MPFFRSPGSSQARRRKHPTPLERAMASEAERLVELVAVGETGLTSRLSRQLVHGDFWDDNVSFQGETRVSVADFGLHGRTQPHRRPGPHSVLR